MLKKFKIKKEHLCTAAMLTYHAMFIGGSTVMIGGYIEELKALKTEITKQADKAEKIVSDVDKSIKDVKKACKRFL